MTEPPDHPTNGTKDSFLEPGGGESERGVTLVLEADDLIHAQRLSIRRNLTRPRAVLALSTLTIGFAAIVLGLIFFIDGRVAVFDAILAVVAPLMGIGLMIGLMLMLVPHRARRTLRESRVLQQPSRCVWSEDGLTVANSYGTATVPWSDLHGWAEDHRVLLIYETRGTMHVIPKRVLTDAHLSDLRSCAARIGWKQDVA